MAKSFLIKAIATTSVVAIATVTMWDSIRTSKAYWYLADNVAVPGLRLLDPELAHGLTIKALSNNLGPLETQPTSTLNTTVWGLNFANPIGLAAGFDKQALAMNGLLDMGFGFIEVGGVTPEPQLGNDKPRMFRLTEDQAVINRFGLNSDGQSIVAERLANFKQQSRPGIVGVNLAKNTTSNDIIGDYKAGVRNLGGNVDFIVLNVSCPNVAWTKELSNSQDDELAKMVCAVKTERDAIFAERKPPLLMKLAPDMHDAAKAHMAEIALHCGVDGLVVSNTTSERAPTLKSKHSVETGGLSGKPIKQIALQSVRDIYRLTHGKIPIIGVGGIESGADAYERIRAGASLLEIYTALVYQGPGLVPKIKQELDYLLRRDGFASVAEAVGTDVKL